MPGHSEVQGIASFSATLETHLSITTLRKSGWTVYISFAKIWEMCLFFKTINFNNKNNWIKLLYLF